LTYLWGPKTYLTLKYNDGEPNMINYVYKP